MAVQILSPVILRAMNLAENHGLRGYDAVQLAVALQIQAERLNAGVTGFTFVSADQGLNNAAVAEGLTVDDPNLHP
jgi:predicted nucleic acid-binding protein